jgi:DNA-binding IclR family transcriptional regulator
LFGGIVEENRSALVKGLTVLEAVQAADRITDIVRLTGLPPSSVHRILKDLCANGWVVEQPGHRYRSGDRLKKLSALAGGNEMLRTMAAPVLGLLGATGLGVSLAVRKGDSMICVANDGVEYPETEIGSVAALHECAQGKAVLATMPVPEALLVLRRAATRSARLSHTWIGLLTRDLEQVRHRGWAFGDIPGASGLLGVAAAVFGANGGDLGAVGLFAPRSQMSPDRVRMAGDRVLSAAREITGVARRSGLGATQ